MSDEFLDTLAEWKKDRAEKALNPPAPIASPPRKRVELTDVQKKVIVNYMLGGVSKGIFEDCEEFWEGRTQEQVDEVYGSYYEASEKFVEELRTYIVESLL